MGTRWTHDLFQHECDGSDRSVQNRRSAGQYDERGLAARRLNWHNRDQPRRPYACGHCFISTTADRDLHFEERRSSADHHASERVAQRLLAGAVRSREMEEQGRHGDRGRLDEAGGLSAGCEGSVPVESAWWTNRSFTQQFQHCHPGTGSKWIRSAATELSRLDRQRSGVRSSQQEYLGQRRLRRLHDGRGRDDREWHRRSRSSRRLRLVVWRLHDLLDFDANGSLQGRFAGRGTNQYLFNVFPERYSAISALVLFGQIAMGRAGALLGPLADEVR